MNQKEKIVIIVMVLIILISSTIGGIYKINNDNKQQGNEQPNQIEQQKSYESINYGIKVEVNGKNMVFLVDGEKNETPMVILPGLGVNAPAITHKPFAHALSDKFKVYSAEPFGYGISDIADTERSIENIVSELHTAVHELGLEKFYLIGHSAGGLYSLKYANEYPEDLLGVIGIDNTPAPFEEAKIGKNETIALFKECNQKLKDGYWKSLDFEEWRTTNFEEFQQYVSPLDFTAEYSVEDMENFQIIFGNNNCNDNLIEEIELFTDNIDSSIGLKFPKDLPSLQFVSTANMGQSDNWKPAHDNLITNSEIQEVVVIDGGHYMHLEQREGIADKIKTWIEKIENN